MAKYELLANVHEGLQPPDGHTIRLETTNGIYQYYHYCCDNINDQGWGCGYRTLQTICSWFNQFNHSELQTERKFHLPVPSLLEIQKILVEIGDKGQRFIGSRDWIGSVEVCLCIDHLYNTPCKIVHVTRGDELAQHVDKLFEHFKTKRSPVMMGGDQDASSKGVVGICETSVDTYLLIVDPHYRGKPCSAQILQTKGWVQWKPLCDFSNSSFYNLCLPQADTITPT